MCSPVIEQPDTPVFGGDARALGGFHVLGLLGEITHGLPPNRGLGIHNQSRTVTSVLTYLPRMTTLRASRGFVLEDKRPRQILEIRVSA